MPGSLDWVLLGCGVVAGPAFVATFLAAGATRPGYDPLRHPVSSLALGPDGWVQQANFGLNGVLYLALAAGLARTHGTSVPPRVGPMLVGVAGLGQITAGLFTTDPVSGYPPGTPPAPQGYSGAAAMIHDVAAVPVFLGIPVAAAAWARAFTRYRRHRWARYSVATAATMLTGFVLTSAAFAQAPALASIGGLLQRLTVTVGMGWLSALSLDALHHCTGRPGSPSS
ncbi:MAG: DUF998 domain-containing protein [Actinomycetota bacterium]